MKGASCSNLTTLFSNTNLNIYQVLLTVAVLAISDKKCIIIGLINISSIILKKNNTYYLNSGF
ncbi:hypothetical protein C0584_02075 [Candidatus Parcubacteria bacterium]|nr:MAG: hypothetical protein C0584_02075 [Candidatus Parcubacteria bacterium]